MSYVSVEVEVPLDCIDDTDLVEELEKRGFKVIDTDVGIDGFGDELHESLYYALRDKNHDRIYHLAAEVVSQSIGRIV